MNQSADSRRLIEDSLSRAEAKLASGGDLSGTGFWKAVSLARRNPDLASEFGARIAKIDRRGFEKSVRLFVPEALGLTLLVGGTAFGVGAVALSRRFTGLSSAITFLIGFGALLVATHSLTHWLVGRMLGMRFTHFFIGGPPPPRPGAKVDYETYLKSSPQRRAAMHASGAVVTKLIPFAMIPVALAMSMPRWVLALLLITGAGQIVTDITLSTRVSDWKKVRRELQASK